MTESSSSAAGGPFDLKILYLLVRVKGPFTKGPN